MVRPQRKQRKPPKETKGTKGTEILIECVKPVKHQPKEVIEYAMAEYMRKLQQEGLMPAEINIVEILTGTGSDQDDEC